MFFTFALIDCKDNNVTVDVLGFENASLLGTATGRPKKIEQVDDWALGVLADLLPLFWTVKDVAAFSCGLADFGNGAVGDIAFF